MAQRVNRGGIKYMLAGGSVVAALGMLTDLTGFMPAQSTSTTKEVCQQVIQEKSALSREALAQLLTVPEGANRSQIQQVAKSPYCQLSEMQVRSGATAQREAYPLAFDPKTWLVVLYEGESYVGYSFTFRR